MNRTCWKWTPTTNPILTQTWTTRNRTRSGANGGRRRHGYKIGREVRNVSSQSFFRIETQIPPARPVEGRGRGGVGRRRRCTASIRHLVIQTSLSLANVSMIMGALVLQVGFSSFEAGKSTVAGSRIFLEILSMKLVQNCKKSYLIDED